MYSIASRDSSVSCSSGRGRERGIRDAASPGFLLKPSLKSHSHANAVQQNTRGMRPYPKPLIMLTCRDSGPGQSDRTGLLLRVVAD